MPSPDNNTPEEGIRMKTNFTGWQQAVILAICFAAVIVAHRQDPLSAQAVTSMATVVISALFVNLRKDNAKSEDKPQ